MPQLKKIEDIDFLNVTVRHVAGGETLTEEKFIEGKSQGRWILAHTYQPDPVAFFEACHCGRRKGDDVHTG